MKQLFLTIIKVICGLNFVGSIITAFNNYKNYSSTESFCLYLPIVFLFLSLTILFHYVDKIIIEKNNNVKVHWIYTVLLISIISFIVGVYGYFAFDDFKIIINGNISAEQMLLHTINIFTLLLIVFLIGFKLFIKDRVVK